MQLINFIIAEDIRQEIGNKVSIMGVFVDYISLTPVPTNENPTNLKLGIYIRLKAENNELMPNNFTLEISLDELKLVEAKGDLIVQGNADSVVVSLSIPPLQIEHFGNLNFSYVFKNTDKILFSGEQTIPLISSDQA